MKMECPDFKSGKCKVTGCPHAGEHEATPDCAMGGSPCPKCVAVVVKECAMCAYMGTIVPCNLCVRGPNTRIDFWTPRTVQAMPADATQTEPYGFCPACGAEGVLRERRPDGDDECANGHRYPSTTSLTVKP